MGLGFRTERQVFQSIQGTSPRTAAAVVIRPPAAAKAAPAASPPLVGKGSDGGGGSSTAAGARAANGDDAAAAVRATEAEAGTRDDIAFDCDTRSLYNTLYVILTSTSLASLWVLAIAMWDIKWRVECAAGLTDAACRLSSVS